MSEGEIVLGAQLQTLKEKFFAEYKFLPNRKFRADFACPEKKLLVEIEGAVWTQGRHTRGSGFIKDIEKYNLATLEGWALLRFTTEQVFSCEAIETIKQFLAR